MQRWDEAYQRLVSFVEGEGHARVPYPYRTDGFRLGTWVAKQRSAKRANRLSKERERRLASLPGWVWDARPVEQLSNVVDEKVKH